MIGTVDAVERVQGFVGNECFRLVSRAGETYYLKSGPSEQVRGEAWACEQARQVEVLAPEIVTVELQARELPAAYLIERSIPGQAISDADEGVLAAAGEQLRRLHSIPGDGWGFLHEVRRESWYDVIRQPFDRLDLLTTAGIIPAELAEQLSTLDPADHVGAIVPVLLHADLLPRHLYAAEGKLTGIIDWGDAAFGDPLFDLGRFSHAGAAPTAALLSGYSLERTAELDHLLVFYRVVWTLMALQWELAAGGDWFAPHVEAIENDLPLLETTR